MDYGRKIPATGPRPRENAALWTAILAAPAAWLFDVCASFLLTPKICSGGPHWTLFVPTLLSGLAAAFGLLLGVRLARRREAHGRARFMAQLGIASSAMFAAITLATLIPKLVLGACEVL
jgi:hypothetical protein